MINLNAGNLWTDPYLDKVIELNAAHDDVKVTSLFGSISGLTPTARSSDRIPFLDEGRVRDYITRAQNNGIAIRYTLNQSCLGSMQDFKKLWDSKLKKTLYDFHAMGVREWTITSALLVETIKEMFPNDFIEVSTIAELATVEDAQRWKYLGADSANVSTSINRDFQMLSAINEVLPITVLANEACLYRCPYRRDCYNFSSHDSVRGDQYFDYYPFRWCNNTRMENPVEWVKARMVAPQWMPLYEEHTGINRFKIAFRTHPESVAIPILEKYMSLYFGGNWCELWPTIAQLGNTDEPVKQTYISLKVMDESRFIQKWLVHPEDCASVRCGIDCVRCYDTYEKAARKS
jgi:hypothetical protein